MKKCNNCNLTIANEDIMIIVHFVLLTCIQKIREALKQQIKAKSYK